MSDETDSLSEMGVEEEVFGTFSERREKEREELIFKYTTRYNEAKSKNIGDEAVCICGNHFIKKTKEQAFCGKRGKGKENNKGRLCKDRYWNTVDETRRFRATLFGR